jgi:hypothetical protein
MKDPMPAFPHAIELKCVRSAQVTFVPRKQRKGYARRGIPELHRFDRKDCPFYQNKKKYYVAETKKKGGKKTKTPCQPTSSRGFSDTKCFPNDEQAVANTGENAGTKHGPPRHASCSPEIP